MYHCQYDRNSCPRSYLSVNVRRLPASVTNLLSCVGHEITWIKDELNRYYDNEESDTIAGEALESLEDAMDDGFMCVDLSVLKRKLEVWHRLFSPHFRNNSKYPFDVNFDYTVTPFFAVKCNPDPMVVEWLAHSALVTNLPLGFDCASITELELAKKYVEKYNLKSVTASRESSTCTGSSRNAIPSTRIVYANPQRAEADLIRALELFATQISEPEPSNGEISVFSKSELWLTVDGIEEVFKIAIARKRFLEKHQSKKSHQKFLAIPQIRIILRIWVPDGHSQVPLGEKFGMRLDQINSVVEACLDHGIDAEDIIGISFHCGSGCESVNTYLEALEMGKTAMTAIDLKINEQLQNRDGTESPKQNSHHRCWLLDIGGGFPGLDGFYGDEGRFSAVGGLTKACYTIDEKKDDNNVIKDHPTTVADIAGAVRPALQSFAASNYDGHKNTTQEDKPKSEEGKMIQPLTLIAEPGRYFVEGAFALASRIYHKQLQVHSDIKRNDRENLIHVVYRIPHGVQGVFKDALLCGESFVPKPLQMQSLKKSLGKKSEFREVLPQRKPTRNLLLSRILGPSGDDTEDVVCDSCWLPELEVGDWLVFDRMGAYTLSIASRAGRPVMRYVMGGGNDNHDVQKWKQTAVGHK